MNLIDKIYQAVSGWIKEAPAPKAASSSKGAAAINPNTLKALFVKAVGLIAGSNRSEFTAPDYDLAEIKRASETDSYIKISLQKYSQLMFKAGYELNSDNDAASEYIDTRFRIMSFSTGIPMDILFNETAEDLFRYSNAFWVKSRIDKIFGGVAAKGVLDVKPVGGYFRVDPSTMKIKRDGAGRVTNYQQEVDGTTKSYKATDVVHFYLDKDAGAAFGKPRVIAAMEDVKLLRRIEGNVLALIYRFSIPLYHWKIGLDTPGFQGTDKEITDMKYEIEKMTLDGSIVTNERTAISAIGAEGQALDASKYLTYFEKRVFAALGVSESQMGRGGAKQDADSMEAQQHNTVKHVQRVFAIFMENFVINELLLEGGFNPIVNIDDVVKYEFNEISTDSRIKRENHEMLKFQSNLVTMEEARGALGLWQEVDEARLMSAMITQPQTLEQIQAKADGAAQIAAARPTAGGTGGNGKTSVKKPTKQATTNNRPTNQHGTGSVKVKESLDDSATTQRERKFQREFAKTYKKFSEARNDIVGGKSAADLVLPLTRDVIVADLKKVIAREFRSGSEKAWLDLGKPQRDWHSPSVSLLNETVESTTKTLMQDLLKRCKTSEEADAAFETLSYRLRFLCEFIAPKAYWYGYVKTCAQAGVAELEIEFDGSEDEDKHKAVINPQKFTLQDIPAFHAYCDCTIKPPKGDVKK